MNFKTIFSYIPIKRPPKERFENLKNLINKEKHQAKNQQKCTDFLHFLLFDKALNWEVNIFTQNLST